MQPLHFTTRELPLEMACLVSEAPRVSSRLRLRAGLLLSLIAVEDADEAVVAAVFFEDGWSLRGTVGGAEERRDVSALLFFWYSSIAFAWLTRNSLSFTLLAVGADKHENLSVRLIFWLSSSKI